MKKVISLLILCGLFFSCKRSHDLNPTEYLGYFESQDAGYIKKVNTVNTAYTIKLLPPDFFALRESVTADREFDRKMFDKRMLDLRDNTYFIIEIRPNGAGQVQDPSPVEKARVVAYYQDLAIRQMRLLIDGNETVAPAFVHYEDNFGLSPDNRMIVCFNHSLSSVGSQIALKYNDALNGNSDINAVFDKAEIGALPKIKF